MRFGITTRNAAPTYGLDSFRNEISNFFDDFLSFNPLSMRVNDWNPLIDVADQGSSIIVKADIPGLSEKDLKVTLENGVLEISGEKSEEDKREKDNYIVRERRFGSFTRSIRLPDGIKADEINAEFKNGVLNIIIPKDEKSAPKKIDIKTN